MGLVGLIGRLFFLMVLLEQRRGSFSIAAEVVEILMLISVFVDIVFDLMIVFFHSFNFSSTRTCNWKLYMLLTVFGDFIETEIVFAGITWPRAEILFLLVVHLSEFLG